MSTDFHTMKGDEEVNASASGEGPTTSAVTFCVLQCDVEIYSLSANSLLEQFARYNFFFPFFEVI